MKIFIFTLTLFISTNVFSQNPGDSVANLKVQKIEKIFNGLNNNTMNLVNEFYHEKAIFEDPLGSHNGVAEIRKYYENLYKNVQEIRFDFSSYVCQNNECVAIWTMHLKTKGLNGGNPTALKGNSFIRFDDNNMVIYHRDYFDMGEFIYEHIPILKNIISFVKNQLKG